MKKTPFWGNARLIKSTPGRDISHFENNEFERCVDFLARMIEKYGSEVELPDATQEQYGEKDSIYESTKPGSPNVRSSA